MTFRVEITAEARADLAEIRDFLIESHLAFGASIEEAVPKVAARLRDIEARTLALAGQPYRGTLENMYDPPLRYVVVGPAISWIEIEEASATVRVLAFFYRGQDHKAAMAKRLRGTGR